MDTFIDIVLGDLHVGHHTGIMYPDPDLDRRPDKYQRWLWRAWNDHFIPDIKAVLDKHPKSYVHGEFGGDMGDKDIKNRSPESYWTRDTGTMVDNLVQLLEPIINWCDAIHVINGTRSHVGGDDNVDNALAKDLDNAVTVSEKIYAWRRVEYELGGLLIDAQHVGKNRSKWASGNLIAALREEIILDRVKNNRRIPDIVYRHHFHYPDCTSSLHKPVVYQIPSWQLPNGYVSEIDPVGRTAVVGGWVNVYGDKQIIESVPLIYTYPKERAWTPK